MTDYYVKSTIAFFIFGAFHSVASHEKFKDIVKKFLGEYFVLYWFRLLYCLISVYLFYYIFRPLLFSQMGGSILTGITQEMFLTFKLINLLGIIISYMAFVQIDYFEFWGISQAFDGCKILLKIKTQPDDKGIAGVDRLEISGIYKFMRHPMLVGGFFMALSVAFLSKVTMYYFFLYSFYMLVGGYYEEKRLRKNLGELYVKYAKEVGVFYPKTLNFKKRYLVND